MLPVIAVLASNKFITILYSAKAMNSGSLIITIICVLPVLSDINIAYRLSKRSKSLESRRKQSPTRTAPLNAPHDTPMTSVPSTFGLQVLVGRRCRFAILLWHELADMTVTETRLCSFTRHA
jgi:hypothetical protein